MAFEDILRNVNLFVDGRGYAGKVDAVTLPVLTLKTEDLRAGGMDAPAKMDMGMEELECTIQTLGVDAELLKLWGVIDANAVALTIRGALQSEDGTVKAVVAQLRGRVYMEDLGTWKAGERSPLKLTINCRYYKLEHDGEAIRELDVDNFIRIINGVDQLEQLRTALGV